MSARSNGALSRSAISGENNRSTRPSVTAQYLSAESDRLHARRAPSLRTPHRPNVSQRPVARLDGIEDLPTAYRVPDARAPIHFSRSAARSTADPRR